MPIGNSASISSVASAAVSNSPCQLVPCSPYIGTVNCQKSPPPQVPNIYRSLTMTPDIGHQVPQTPDVMDHSNSGSNVWRRPTPQRLSVPQGEQMVPQTPTSTNALPYIAARAFRNSHSSTTPKRPTHRERRKLPNMPDVSHDEATEEMQTSNSQLNLFRGDEIFG